MRDLILKIQAMRDTSGQDLVEYALMAGFVAVAGGAVWPSTVMPAISAIFSKVNSATAAAASQGSAGG